MSDVVLIVLVSILNYLLGSIPFSYFIAKAKGVDLREVGSGNVGATNVVRSIGLPYGIAALVLDGLKGFLGASLVLYAALPISISALSVFGHNWSIFLGFKSGKGVATTLGVLMAIHWPTFVIVAAMWMVIAVITRYVSVASVIALFGAPVSLALWGLGIEAIALALGLAVIGLVQHRDNFRRLFAGEENRA